MYVPVLDELLYLDDEHVVLFDVIIVITTVTTNTRHNTRIAIVRS